MNIIGVVVILIIIAGVVGFIFWRARQGSSPSQGIAPPPLIPAPSTNKPAPVLTGKRNWFVGTGGSSQGKNFHVGSRTTTIGRAPTNFVQINDEDTSRIQAKVSPTPSGGLEILDMGSKNGTFVNDKRLGDEPQALKDGDEIKVGNDTLVYRASGDYGSNHGLQRKSAGKGSIKSTELSEGNFDEILTKTLEETNNDLELTAQRLEVTVALLKRYLAKR